MFPFVVLQADKLLGEPRNTNVFPFLYAVHYFSKTRLSNTNTTAYLQMHIHKQTKKNSAFVIHSAVANTITQYISTTTEIITRNFNTEYYDKLRAQELMCLFTFQSNDNFILS
jgi:hypothetical protein